MNQHAITPAHLDSFRRQLIQEEKSTVTIEKYLRDTRAFLVFLDGRAVTKEDTITYKNYLVEQGYAVASINSMLASVNRLLEMLGWNELKVKNLRAQRQIYCAEEKELTKAEYMRLLKTAKNRPRLNLVMQTICGTGIRVSELKYFTRESVQQGTVPVRCKGKTRAILIPGKSRKLLLDYAKKAGIRSGPIFVTRSGKPLDRSNIWSQMKPGAKKERGR